MRILGLLLFITINIIARAIPGADSNIPSIQTLYDKTVIQ